MNELIDASISLGNHNRLDIRRSYHHISNASFHHIFQDRMSRAALGRLNFFRQQVGLHVNSNRSTFYPSFPYFCSYVPITVPIPF